ncbi:MAG TPA: NUDIX hydrolase [Patescibacteria group bacterium]
MENKSKAADLKRGIDFIGVNCTFWCHDGKGKVLLHKRSQQCRDEQGTWDSGAGSMEFGESFEQTVRREVLEEYGVEPLEITYIATENVIRHHNNRKTHWIKNIHCVLVDPLQVKNNEPEKIDEIGWFDPDELPSPLHSQVALEVSLVKNFLKRNV